jgi:hypothetical protein
LPTRKHDDITAAKVIQFLIFDEDNLIDPRLDQDGAQQWPGGAQHSRATSGKASIPG